MNGRTRTLYLNPEENGAVGGVVVLLVNFAGDGDGWGLISNLLQTLSVPVVHYLFPQRCRRRSLVQLGPRATATRHLLYLFEVVYSY